jgi:hypothetical protein
MKWATTKEPTKEGRYFVTIKSSFGNQIRIADRCKTHIGTWAWHLLGNVGYSGEVVAWIKCPKPYEELNQ